MCLLAIDIVGTAETPRQERGVVHPGVRNRGEGMLLTEMVEQEGYTADSALDAHRAER